MSNRRILNIQTIKKNKNRADLSIVWMSNDNAMDAEGIINVKLKGNDEVVSRIYFNQLLVENHETHTGSGRRIDSFYKRCAAEAIKHDIE